MATDTEGAVAPTLAGFLGSVELSADVSERTPMLTNGLTEIDEGVGAEQRFISALAAVAYNMEVDGVKFDKERVQGIIGRIDELVADQLNSILHHPAFQELEAAWRSIDDLCKETNFKANIEYALLDASKDELYEDLEINAADIAGSELFKKIYVSEYDQFGGRPFGAMIGLYEFLNTPDDLHFLKVISKIGAASHAPFHSAVHPKFFGCDSMEKVSQLRDIEGMLTGPKYSKWASLREGDESAYVALALPRHLGRIPYNDETNPARGINFEEKVSGTESNEYLWANSAMLMARCLVKSFETSGWCQHLRGVKGGGLISDLPSHSFSLNGQSQIKLPMEIQLADFRELDYANSGFAPLVGKKYSGDAVFFSMQSIKKAHVFEDPKDSENSQLVSNICYTHSISRIAHYLKSIMRDNIGSTADEGYIQNEISSWINRYVTTVVNPDDLTLRYFPFKAFSVEVSPIEGRIGWYHCNASILPHVQFEGMDVDLRVDARLS